MAKRPGGEMASRPLHFTWIADTSGSMSLRGKMDGLNAAVRKCLPQMREVADENPFASVLVQVLRFSHGASWLTKEPVPLDQFAWTDLKADPLPHATADIVFLVDTSGSMGDEIEGIRSSCAVFADEIIRRGAAVRLGLIGFDIGGYSEGWKRSVGRTRPYSVHQLSTYTIGTWPLSNPKDFKVSVQELHLGMFGGLGCYLANDDSVDIFPHVVRAFQSSTATSRVLVIVSDEIGSTEGVPNIVTQLKEAGVTAYVLGVPGKNKAHQQIALQTGGQFWSIFKAKGNHDFSSLLLSVAASIAEEVIARLPDGSTSSGTDMGRALTLLADRLKMPPMPERALPPVLVLLSDGKPTDDFAAGLKQLMDQPWSRKAVRLAIAIGDDVDLSLLEQFTAHPDLKPFAAHNPESLAQYIRWASTAVLKATSSPACMGSSAVPLAPPPLLEPRDSGERVW